MNGWNFDYDCAVYPYGRKTLAQYQCQVAGGFQPTAASQNKNQSTSRYTHPTIGLRHEELDKIKIWPNPLKLSE